MEESRDDREAERRHGARRAALADDAEEAEEEAEARVELLLKLEEVDKEPSSTSDSSPTRKSRRSERMQASYESWQGHSSVEARAAPLAREQAAREQASREHRAKVKAAAKRGTAKLQTAALFGLGSASISSAWSRESYAPQKFDLALFRQAYGSWKDAKNRSPCMTFWLFTPGRCARGDKCQYSHKPPAEFDGAPFFRVDRAAIEQAAKEALQKRAKGLWSKMRGVKRIIGMQARNRDAEESNLYSPFCLRRAAVCALAQLHAAGAKAPREPPRVRARRRASEAALVLGYEAHARARAPGDEAEARAAPRPSSPGTTRRATSTSG